MPNWRETANRGFTTYPGVGAHDHQGNTTSNDTYACSWYAPGNFYSEPEQAGWLPDSFFPGHTEEMRATLALYDHESYQAAGLVDYLSLSPPFVASGDGLVTRGPASWREPQWLDLESLGPAAFELNAETGTYTLTGAAATLLATRLLSADPGVYGLTGLAADLAKGFLMVADPGTYTVTGQDASLLATRLLSADPGVYTLTGAAASLLAGHLLSADPGAYVLTGFDAELVFSPAAGAFVLVADPGAYLVTGADAELIFQAIVEAAAQEPTKWREFHPTWPHNKLRRR